MRPYRETIGERRDPRLALIIPHTYDARDLLDGGTRSA